MVTFSYAKNNILRRKARFVASILIIGIVVGMFVGFSLSAYSFNEHIKKLVNINLGNADFLITNVTGFIDVEKVKDIESLDFVESVDYYLVLYGKAIKDDNVTGAALYGIGNGFYWKSKLGDVKLSGDEAIITEPLANSIGAEKGDKLLYVAFWERNYTLLNITVEDIAKVKKISAWETVRLEIYVNISYIWEKIPVFKNKISAIYVKLKEGYNETLAEEKLKSELKGLKVERLKLQIPLDFESNILLLLIYLIVSSVLFLILVFYMNVEERRKEIGILKALGASNKQIFLTLVLEAFLYSIIGTILGFGLGIGFAYILLEKYKTMCALKEAIPIYFRIRTFIIGGMLGLLIPTLSITIISRPALKLKPVEVLRHIVEEPAGKLGKGLLITGIVFLSMGITAIFVPQLKLAFWWARSAGLEIMLPIILFYLFGDKLSRALERVVGVSGKLAPVFLKRKINRAILMVILLGIALSFTHTTVVAGKAFEYVGLKTYENMHFDIMLTFSTPMPWNISEELKSIEGVEDALVLGSTVTLSGNRTVILAFLDINKFKEFIGWKPKYGSLEDLGENDTIIFESGLKRIYPWLINDSIENVVGKQLNISTEVGNITVKVKAILESTLGEFWVNIGGISLAVAIYLNQSFAEKFFPFRYYTMVTGAIIKVKKGYAPEDVKERIIKKYGKNSVIATTKDEWLQESFKISAQIGSFYFMIGYMLYLVAVSLIFITLHKTFMIWRRDIATIRSFGASRKDVLTIFILQAIMTSLLAIVAIGIDIVFSVPGFLKGISMSIGVNLPVMYCWKDFAVLSIITVIVAIIGALPSGIRAIRDNIAEALRIE